MSMLRHWVIGLGANSQAQESADGDWHGASGSSVKCLLCQFYGKWRKFPKPEQL